MSIVERPILLRNTPKDEGAGDGNSNYLSSFVKWVEKEGFVGIKDPLHPNLRGTYIHTGENGELLSHVPGEGDFDLDACAAEDNLNSFLERNTGWKVNRNFGRKPV
jgi:hypothetical protein